MFFALYYYCCQTLLNIYLQFLLLYLESTPKSIVNILLLSKVICYIFAIEIKYFFKSNQFDMLFCFLRQSTKISKIYYRYITIVKSYLICIRSSCYCLYSVFVKHFINITSKYFSNKS